MPPSPLVPVAQAAAAKYGVPAPILMRQINEESGWRPDAKSPAGALGPMQLMPGTARGLGVNPLDPVQNIDGGARYLREQYDRFGSWEKALAAYNAGPGRVVDGSWQHIPETVRYVNNILTGLNLGAGTPSGKGAPTRGVQGGGVPAMTNADFALLETIARGGDPSPAELMASMGAPAAADPLSAPLPVPAARSSLAAPVTGKFERVDQGVDFMASAPPRALASGTVVSVGKGMAGGTGDIIKIKLDHPVTVNGRTYDHMYYSEERPLVQQGQRVTAGQAVMAAGGNEIGFLDSNGNFPPLIGGLGAGTQPTQEGADFLKLLKSLGVPT